MSVQMKKQTAARKLPVNPTSGLSLRLNFSWTFVGNIIYAACQWGMLVVLAKLGSPEIVGQFALGLAVTAPVIMFSNLQLRGVQATDARQEYAFGDYLGLRLATTLLALLVVAGIVVVSGYRQETALVVLVVGLSKAFESISDIFFGLLQQHERMDRIAISKMIKGPLSLVALGAGVALSGSVLWGAVGLAVAWAAVLCTYDLSSVRYILALTSNEQAPRESLRPSFDARRLIRLAWLALPLGVVMMLVSLNTNIPRYFIERQLGERELGIFAALSYLMVAGSVVISALGQSATPRLAKYYAAGNTRAFRVLTLKLLAMGGALGALVVLMGLVAGRELLTLMYSAEYALPDLFVILMSAAAVYYMGSFLGYSMTAARYFRVQMPLFAVVAGSAALSCFLLIPTYGLYGAAAAVLITALVQLIGSLAIVIHAWRTNASTEGVTADESHQTD